MEQASSVQMEHCWSSAIHLSGCVNDFDFWSNGFCHIHSEFSLGCPPMHFSLEMLASKWNAMVNTEQIACNWIVWVTVLCSVEWLVGMSWGSPALPWGSLVSSGCPWQVKEQPSPECFPAFHCPHVKRAQRWSKWCLPLKEVLVKGGVLDFGVERRFWCMGNSDAVDKAGSCCPQSLL